MSPFPSLNAAGLGVCVNTLASLPTSADGLPVACVIRGVLDLECVATVRGVSGYPSDALFPFLLHPLLHGRWGIGRNVG